MIEQDPLSKLKKGVRGRAIRPQLLLPPPLLFGQHVVTWPLPQRCHDVQCCHRPEATGPNDSFTPKPWAKTNLSSLQGDCFRHCVTVEESWPTLWTPTWQTVFVGTRKAIGKKHCAHRHLQLVLPAPLAGHWRVPVGCSKRRGKLDPFKGLLWKRYHLLMGTWRNWNPHTLLMGIRYVANLENCLAISTKAEKMPALQFSSA